MKANSETKYQKLGWVLGVPLRGRRNCRHQRGQGHHRKPTETATLGQGDSESELITRDTAWNWLRPPAYVAVLVGGTMGLMEMGVDALTGIPSALGGSWETFPQDRFPCQAWIQGEVLCLTATWYAMLHWCPWEACSFLKKFGGKLDYSGEGSWRIGGKGDCSQDVKQIIFKKAKWSVSSNDHFN